MAVVEFDFIPTVGPSGIASKRPPAGAYKWQCLGVKLTDSGDLEFNLKALDSSNPDGIGLQTKVWENRPSPKLSENANKARTGSGKALLVCVGKPYAAVAVGAKLAIDTDFFVGKTLHSWYEPKNPDASDIKGDPSYEQGFDQNRWLWTTGDDAAGNPTVDPAGAYEAIKSGARVIGLQNTPLRQRAASAATAAMTNAAGTIAPTGGYAGPSQAGPGMAATPPNNGVAQPQATQTARPPDGAAQLL